jgi:PQQ-dependent catabolism-associated CXXCW motif protein
MAGRIAHVCVRLTSKLELAPGQREETPARPLSIVLLNRSLFALLVGLFALAAPAAVPIPTPAQDQTFSYEDKDFGVSSTSTPQGPPFGKPTPTTIPGARVIKTLQLKALLDSEQNVVVIDVLDSKTRTTVPRAYWMPGAGDSRFFAAEKARFAAALEKLTGGDKTRPVAFICLSSECWESYNACLHAIEAGYTDVLWYRGGTNAWGGANLERKPPERLNW